MLSFSTQVRNRFQKPVEMILDLEINLIENMLNGLVVDAPIALEKMKKVSTLSKLAFEKIKR